MEKGNTAYYESKLKIKREDVYYNPHTHYVFAALARGKDEFELIGELLGIITDYQQKTTELAVKTPNPVIVYNPNPPKLFQEPFKQVLEEEPKKVKVFSFKKLLNIFRDTQI